MPKITVIFFAALSDITGTRRLEMEIPEGTTVGELKRILLERYPGVEKSFQGIVTSIGQETAEDDEIIPDGAQVALFHPIAGGDGQEAPTIVRVTDEPLDVNGLITQITTPAVGAVVTFVGTVRGFTRGKQTSALEYEAYKPMAEAKLRQIAAEIRARWPKIEGIVLIQRIGHLEVGTPTTFVACSSPHRGDGAFEAARYGIDRLKEIVPVWKKEISPNGEEWVEGHNPIKQTTDYTD